MRIARRALIGAVLNVVKGLSCQISGIGDLGSLIGAVAGADRSPDITALRSSPNRATGGHGIAQHDHTATCTVSNVETSSRHAALSGVSNRQHRATAVQRQRTAVGRGTGYRSSTTRQQSLGTVLVEAVLCRLQAGSRGRAPSTTGRTRATRA